MRRLDHGVVQSVTMADTLAVVLVLKHLCDPLPKSRQVSVDTLSERHGKEFRDTLPVEQRDERVELDGETLRKYSVYAEEFEFSLDGV
jgi:hypothetical protein